MKRLLAALLAILLLLSGCSILSGIKETLIPSGGIGTDLSVYPSYDNLTDREKEIWEEIRTAMENHLTLQIQVGTYSSQPEVDAAKDRLNHFMRELAFSYPDYYWVNAYSFQVFTTAQNGLYTLAVQPDYIMDKDQADELRPAYDQKVDSIVSTAKEIPDLFDRVLYVHDTILAGARYDYNLAESSNTTDIGRTAYGCLMEGRTVCSGYALAFRSVMDKLGIESGVEFNSYNTTPSSDGHVWNYCRLDGEYYYFDLTWNDTGLEGDAYPEIPYTYLYFGVTDQELSASSDSMDPNAPTPDCTGTQYNYFIHQGLNFPKYDYNSVKTTVQTHKNDGFITLRFDTPEALADAEKALIQDQEIFDMLPGVNDLSYIVCETGHHLILIF